MADSQDAIELRRRARRRLVGAIALVVFMVIALPIVLDREPKPVSQELTIQIPSQDPGRFASRVSPPEPPAQTADASMPAGAQSAAPQAATGPAPAVVSAAPPAREARPGSPATEAAAGKSDKAAKAEASPAPRTEALAPAPAKAESAKAATVTAKPEAASKPAAKSEKAAAVVKEAARDAPQIAEAVPSEAKPGAEPRYIVPLGLFSKPDNIKQVRSKASAAGIKTYTEAMAGSDRVRVRAGPFATRDAAEKARERLRSAGLEVGAVAVVR